MKNGGKVLFTIILAALLAGSAGAAFDRTKTYSNSFGDVAGDAWYSENVKCTYELGLMDGTGERVFNPGGNVTIAEAVTVASRAHAIYNEKEIHDADGQWYAKYIAYAKENGILTEELDDYGRAAKRFEVASLFAKALPDEYYNAINSVEDIPDVPESREYYDDILKLYNAGVVMGSDSYGFFYPESNITRAEMAAVISRAAITDTRLEKTIDSISEDGAFYLCYNGEESSNHAWDIDLRGAVPKVNVAESFSGLFDVFDDAPTAYIRRFNKTETGLITLETKVEMYGDGAYLEYRNHKDEPVYRLEIVDSSWSVLKADGSYEVLTKANGADDLYMIKVNVDLDNGRSTTFIDGKEYATLPLLTDKENTNILNFRFATTKEAIATIKPVLIDIYSNYAVLDGFLYTPDGSSPYFWNTDAVVKDEVMLLEGGKKASRTFSPASGKIASEFNVILPLGEDVSYDISSKGNTVLEFKSDNGAFYANGEKVYESFVSNLWYRMRFELDTDTQTVLVKLNGRKIGEVPFASSTTSVDAISVENHSESSVSLDNFKVFGLKEFDNYVPAPQIPKGEEKYTVGLNVCSIWLEGTHAGWTSISAFDEIEPVLGYYDEGNPETADWEIKLMKEHGIDIQAFCWYADASNAPLKDLGLASQLHDGFMNAKYSHMMSYCLIMEAANAKSPDSLESWKTYYVPYLIENYFKDERYAKIDNMLPFGWFGGSTFINSIGGSDAAYEALEYLEDEVRKLGFDGMLYFLGNSEREANIGSDGYAAYSWGQMGYSKDVQINAISKSLSTGYAHHIPTISVGFNNVAWAGTRYPLITKEDYDFVHNWVINEQLPQYTTEKWQENFVWISTWNEYGEGTYVMPTTEGHKFDYLDVIRKYYTDEGEDESINVVPDESQKYRINHLYPQYRHDLRRKHQYQPEMEEVYVIDYATHSSGTSSVSLGSIVKDSNGLTGVGSDKDPMIIVGHFDKEVNTAFIPEIRITMKGVKGNTVEVFYKTSESDSWGQSKSVSFSITSDEEETYVINTSGLESWNGILTGFRIDPTQKAGESFTVKKAVFLSDYKPNMLSKTVTIDEKTFISTFAPEKNKAGKIVMAYDPQKYMSVRMGAFHTWDKENGILTLEFKEHTVVYTVGSDKYIFDAEEKSLGFTLEEIDGLPVIPIEMLCNELGYSFTVNENNEIIIETPSLTYFDEVDKNSALGVWEFNTPGYVEGWRSDYMKLQTDKGYLRAKSTSDFTDPIIWSKSGIAIPADEFNKLEIRVRYKYNSSWAQPIQVYYITDVDKKWNEAKTINFKLKSTDSMGEFEEYEIDLSNAKEWKDTVTALRFDPFNASGEIDIDYIRFVYDPALEKKE